MEIFSHPVFRGITPEELSQMEAGGAFQRKRFRRGEYILRAGGVVSQFGLVCRGSVQIECSQLWGERSIRIKVIFGNLSLENGLPRSRVFLAEAGQLTLLPALGGASYFNAAILPSAECSKAQSVPLTIDGQEKRALLLLGDWRGLPLPATDAELVIALSPQPLVIGESKLPYPKTTLPLLQLGSIGLMSLGKANYLFAGHSSFYDGNQQLLAAAPFFSEGSMMSELGRETVSAYAAAKGGLKMLTRNICSEYGEYNIQCNGIGPGYIATPQTAPLREKQPDGSRHPFDQFIISKTPAARWGNPEDLQGPAAFLASEASDFVNGHILYVDGGILAYIGKQPK